MATSRASAPIRYRVSRWAELFENNRTRELKRMEWVPFSNRMDGLGYLTLVDHPNGASHLGAWLAIVEIASRQKVRGDFPQEGAGIPQALAVISRLPAGLFEEVIPRLLEIDWIEQVTEIPQEGAGIPQEGAGIPQEGAPRDARASASEKGMEGKGTEGNPQGNPRSVRQATLIERDAGWDQFREVWGRICETHPSEPDWQKSLETWRPLSGEQKTNAVRWLEQLAESSLDDPARRSLPANFLRNRVFERVRNTTRPPVLASDSKHPGLAYLNRLSRGESNE